MGKRILCLICAVIILCATALGTEAQGWEEKPPNAQSGTVHLASGSVARSTTPLVSAMFLILAGLGISMLFDKRDKR